MRTSYTYDEDKNITKLQAKVGNKSIVDNIYKYDENGNQIQKQGVRGTTSYIYDELNRVKEANYPSFKEEFYYDKSDNRTKK